MKPATAATLAYLRLRGKDGATEAEIQAATAIRSGAQRIHELRSAGHRIDKVMERSPIGAAYARWTLVERPAFRPLAGSQTGLGL